MYAVVDVETTGRIPGKHEILTIGTVIADDNYKEIASFHRGIRPQEIHLWDKKL